MALVTPAFSSAPPEPPIPKVNIPVSIVIDTAPKSVDPGQKVSITWRVEGTGKISHTAVHWDSKHGNPADFASYGKATPDFAAINPPGNAPSGYTVSFDAPSSGIIYYVVHATVNGSQFYNKDGERSITVGGTDVRATSGVSAASGIDTNVLLGVGIIVPIVVVVAVALIRRKKTA